MSHHVAWVLELTVADGKAEEFRSLMAEMVEATERNEPGTLHYEWSTSDDGRACQIYERYGDSAAVLEHLAAFGERFAERFLQILTPNRLVVFGHPSQEVRAALAGFQPVFTEPVGGFVR